MSGARRNAAARTISLSRVQSSLLELPMNVFVKPSAEPNLFRLCRGEKTKRENQRFYSAITDCTDTPPRQNATEICSCPRLIRTLAVPKILPLGNAQINLTLPSLIRIFDCVLDTPSRHNQACACFCARLFVSLSSKPDSGRPRSVDDASATDAASGSQKRRSWDSTR